MPATGAHDRRMATTPGEWCTACSTRPQVAVAVAHRAMRTLIVDLLAHGDRWAVSAVDGVAGLGDAVSALPDLAVVDAADVKACRLGVLGSLALGRVVVIGPEPDPAYRRAVLDQGVGGWVTRDSVAEELSSALSLALGCPHSRAPPSAERVLAMPTDMTTPDLSERPVTEGRRL